MTVEELEKENAALIAENEKLKSAIETAEAVIDELQGKLESASSVETQKNPVITCGGKEYEITLKRFQHAGKVFTADDLATNKELQKELLSTGSEILKLVEKQD